MIVYSLYALDARVRREAETLVSEPDYDVTVIALKEKAFPRTYLLEGVKVHELNVPKYRGASNSRYLLSYLSFCFSAFCACTRLFFKTGIDVVHVHNMPNLLVFCGILPALMGKLIVLDVHDTVIETYASKFKPIPNRMIRNALFTLFRLEETLSCAFSDKIIAVNEIQRHRLIGRGIPESKTIISMNVPDPKRFYRTDSELKTRQNPHFNVVYFGTITQRLGIDLAIRAMKKLVDHIPGIQLHIIGSGEDKLTFKQLSESLNLDSIVRFSETFCSLKELLTILQKMDVSVIPNRRTEATELMLPVKMMESIALGIPVVVPRLEAIQHYFSDDMVFYFEPDDVDSMAHAILNVYQEERNRIEKVRNARKFLDEYGWEKHKHILLDAYKQLVTSSVHNKRR
jgi:glycosyltransferase involved in cell wall biosynthesis